MDNKKLFQKLNNFKNIQPNNEWKNHCREILFSQISNGQMIKNFEQEKIFSWKIFFSDFFSQLIIAIKTKTVLVNFSIIALLVGCGFTSVYASRNTNPSDSLYIAKIISEKAQFAVVFNEKEKAKLNLKFAVNRVEEINQLLKMSVVDETIKQDKNVKVEKLTSNFKKEISQAKVRLNKIKVINNAINKVDNNSNINENQQFFSAGLNKDNKHVEISEPVKVGVNNKTEQLVVATSTKNVVDNNINPANKILEEAEKLFNNKDYNESINKLEEVNNVIIQTVKKDDDNLGQILDIIETK